MAKDETARIIHFEDDEAFRILVQQALGAAGHQVEGAEVPSPAKILDDIDQVHPVLVIIGDPLPPMEPLGTMKIPVLVVSRECSDETILSVWKTGAAFLQKPVDLAEMVTFVKRLLQSSEHDLKGQKANNFYLY